MLEKGCKRELRHDFRRYYSCSYDDVGVDEALDLVLTLPQGSLYISKKYPQHSWSEAKEISADIRDWIAQLAFAMRGLTNPPHIIRPADAIADAKSKEKARKARTILEGGKWKDIERR